MRGVLCVDYRVAVGGEGNENPLAERERERTCYRTCEKKEEEQEPPLGSPKDRNQLVSTQCRSFCTWSGHFLIAFLFKDQVFLLLDARDYYYYEVEGAGNSKQ